MAHSLSVAAVESKSDTNTLRIVAGDFKTIRTPTEIRLLDRDAAVMQAFLLTTGVFLQEKAVLLRDPIDTLAVCGCIAPGFGPTAQYRPYPRIAIRMASQSSPP